MTSRRLLAPLLLAAALLLPALAVSTGPAPVSAAPAGPAAPAGDGVTRRPAYAAQVDRVPIPRLDWRRCRRFEDPGSPQPGFRVQCERVQVPLDYDRPRGPRTTLNLVRVPAASPQRRIGTLFVNPGGPGGPSASFAPFAADLLGPRIHRRFDVVGVDPRGTGGSGRTVCRVESQDYRWLDFPLTDRQERRTIANDDLLRRACRRDASRLVDHASTADNARDMELLRRAVGDERLSYYGISYGTYLGATYAAMFPDRVRAMVVDGVLDPVAWSTGARGHRATTPFTTRLGSGAGADEALRAAFADCRAADGCPLARPAAVWERLLREAAAGELEYAGYAVSYQELVGTMLSSLYDRASLRQTFPYLRQLARGGNPTPRGLALRRRVTRVVDERGVVGPWLPSVLAARPVPVNALFPAVTCSDTRNPGRPRAWEQAARRQDRVAPGFGRLWTWSSSPCARGGIGSGDDSFRGPWRTRTSYPLLVVGNSHDPATPIPGARALHRLLPGSALVEYEQFGHGALGGGRCVTGLMAGYLVGRDLPRPGRTCSAPPLFR